MNDLNFNEESLSKLQLLLLLYIYNAQLLFNKERQIKLGSHLGLVTLHM